jgi:hypothetical protein
MICEGILTTKVADGQLHIAPMGPIVDESWRTLLLRPYQTSTTFANLVRSRQGVFHITDDAELIARAAIGKLDATPATIAIPGVETPVLADACRYLAFRITKIDDSRERAELAAEVTQSGTLREFFGFCRAKHAVIEAAILATRTAILPAENVYAQLAAWEPLVTKTGGPAELRAWQLVCDVIHQAYANPTERPGP